MAEQDEMRITRRRNQNRIAQMLSRQRRENMVDAVSSCEHRWGGERGRGGSGEMRWTIGDDNPSQS